MRASCTILRTYSPSGDIYDFAFHSLLRSIAPQRAVLSTHSLSLSHSTCTRFIYRSGAACYVAWVWLGVCMGRKCSWAGNFSKCFGLNRVAPTQTQTTAFSAQSVSSSLSFDRPYIGDAEVFRGIENEENRKILTGVERATAELCMNAFIKLTFFSCHRFRIQSL